MNLADECKDPRLLNEKFAAHGVNLRSMERVVNTKS
jgi:hypothetical protein